MSHKQDLFLDPTKATPVTRHSHVHTHQPTSLPPPKEAKVAPPGIAGSTPNAGIYFVGTATTIIEWEGIRIMTDPNFLHAGDHVHLGPGVTGTRVTNPALDLHELPHVDAVLLSHYHADHFDHKVEDELRRDLPIITTPHAKKHLANKGGGESFTGVHDLDFYDSLFLNIGGADGARSGDAASPAVRVIGMPGKHVPPGPAGAVGKINDLLQAVPPTNGWMLELGYRVVQRSTPQRAFRTGYRIYISGDTLLIPELEEIPKRYPGQNIDLMLVHLGGTTIPGPSAPLLMVTMDAKQGVELVRLINPDVTIPIHFDDYDVFMSPLNDFKKEVERAGLGNKVVYLDRGDQYRFSVPV